MDHDFDRDISAIEAIPAVPTILEVICRTTGMGFAAVARVTEDRWIACAVRDEIAFGLKPGSELVVETTICHEIRALPEAVVIDHVAEDPAYRDHPTPRQYGFQSYISMPIILPDGRFFGTLCAVDPRPARLRTPEVIGMFRLFAELIAFHLDAHRRVAESEAALAGERETAELREQFIAVLGHDLRNPLAAIASGTRLLLSRAPDEFSVQIIGMMQASVTRMTGLIENVLDFARGRLGGGIALTRRTDEPVAPLLLQVLAEMRTAQPERVIEARIDLPERLHGDSRRIAQLFSNLLGNALTHGAEDTPVRAEARMAGGMLELSVANGGTPIPAEKQARLFQPFFRGSAAEGGLGLGLYIAAEIARAHDGTIEVRSTPEETVFTFRMPA
ncbi:sensor histidine kinase [Roseococcus sp. SYP-B2431]|uniref:GAF domain-containing sensor histidine kinase n=1 Tax=Roseococcus sp. SYP-B2431 TaxID=2496640 RepID=UPI00103E886A|nr:GAF domain-containing sensor histidine kinase [Roseococcus sp. SYP-B2431]TCH96720.1 sensor histidine kinase [Roseococcus sp. SYP-B2431]